MRNDLRLVGVSVELVRNRVGLEGCRPTGRLRNLSESR